MDLAKAIDFAVKAGFGNYAYEAAGIFHELVNEVEQATLEKAAVECEQSEAYRGSVFAQRIRALKPVTTKPSDEER